MRWLAPAILLLFLGCSGCSRLIADRFLRPPVFPERDQRLLALADQVRQRWGTHFQRITYHGANDTLLNADLLIPRQAPRGTIVLLHGLGDRKEGMLTFAEAFASAGYLTIAPDLRAHGDSTARYTTFGYLERWDCIALLNAVARTDLSLAGLPRADVSHIGVIGGSLGASVALEWAQFDPRVRTIIALAPYATLRDEADYLYARATPPLSPDRIDQIETAIQKEGHFRIDDVRPLATVKQRPLPLYLVRGDEDTVIPPAESDRLFTAATGPVVLQRVPHTGHEDLVDALGKEFLSRAVAWMNAYVPAEAAQPAPLPQWIFSLPHRNLPPAAAITAFSHGSR
jgi:alpha-beta hydrolase superfamily lysophospholipase